MPQGADILAYNPDALRLIPESHDGKKDTPLSQTYLRVCMYNIAKQCP